MGREGGKDPARLRVSFDARGGARENPPRNGGIRVARASNPSLPHGVVQLRTDSGVGGSILRKLGEVGVKGLAQGPT